MMLFGVPLELIGAALAVLTAAVKGVHWLFKNADEKASLYKNLYELRDKHNDAEEKLEELQETTKNLRERLIQANDEKGALLAENTKLRSGAQQAQRWYLQAHKYYAQCQTYVSEAQRLKQRIEELNKLKNTVAAVSWNDEILPPRFSPSGRVNRKFVVGAFVNFKGGVGKTTLCNNIAHALFSKHGKRVLMIDLDPQGNLSEQNIERREVRDGDRVAMTMFRQYVEGKEVDFRDFVYPSRLNHEGVDIVPEGNEAMQFEDALVYNYVTQPKDPRGIWHEILSGDDFPWDVVLIDCPPSLGLLTQSAMAAADLMLMPVNLSDFAVKGLQQMIHLTRRWRRMLALEELRIGIIPNRVKLRKGELISGISEVYERIKKNYEDYLFPEGAWIPADEGLMAKHLEDTPPLLNARSSVSEGFDNVVERVLSMLKEVENAESQNVERSV